MCYVIVLLDRGSVYSVIVIDVVVGLFWCWGCILQMV